MRFLRMFIPSSNQDSFCVLCTISVRGVKGCISPSHGVGECYDENWELSSWHGDVISVADYLPWGYLCDFPMAVWTGGASGHEPTENETQCVSTVSDLALARASTFSFSIGTLAIVAIPWQSTALAPLVYDIVAALYWILTICSPWA